MNHLGIALKQAAVVGRWAARITGTLAVLFFFAFLIGEGPPRLSQLTTEDRLIFLCLGGLLLGLVLAWKWEGLGGLMTLTTYALMVLVNPRTAGMLPFSLAAGIGLLHVLCWWMLRGATVTGRLPATVWAALGIFVLLCGNEMFGNPPLMTPRVTPASEVVGSWQGKAKSWPGQTDVEILLVIGPDLSVAGTIGRSSFTVADAKITGNRTWFGRIMNWRSDYLIRGQLSGDPFAAHLSIKGEALRGGVRLSKVQGFGPLELKRRS